MSNVLSRIAISAGFPTHGCEAVHLASELTSGLSRFRTRASCIRETVRAWPNHRIPAYLSRMDEDLLLRDNQGFPLGCVLTGQTAWRTELRGLHVLQATAGMPGCAGDIIPDGWCKLFGLPD